MLQSSVEFSCKKIVSVLEAVIKRIHELMKNLGTLKKSAILRKSLPLRPIIQNDTRWSSTYNMISRYIELKPFIDTTDGDLVLFLPSADEDFETRKLFDSLQKFEDVSSTLQTESGIDLKDARALFDDLFVSYPGLSYYLSFDHSSISKNQNFEKAIILANSGLSLTTEQKYIARNVACRHWRNNHRSQRSWLLGKNPVSDKNQFKDNVSCLSWIPPTSNVAERLFSRAKFMMMRKKVSPSNFESQMFFMINKAFWTPFDVQEIL